MQPRRVTQAQGATRSGTQPAPVPPAAAAAAALRHPAGALPVCSAAAAAPSLALAMLPPLPLSDAIRPPRRRRRRVSRSTPPRHAPFSTPTTVLPTITHHSFAHNPAVLPKSPFSRTSSIRTTNPTPAAQRAAPCAASRTHIRRRWPPKAPLPRSDYPPVNRILSLPLRGNF